MLGIPAIAVSQQADHGAMDFRAGRSWERALRARRVASSRASSRVEDVQIPEGRS